MQNIFPTISMPRAQRRLERIPLQHIRVNPNQMRARFDAAEIESLADSIRQCGLLSPLIVRRLPEQQFELIAGERRLRALTLLGADSADALVLHAADRDSALIALVENLQRVDLNFFEEAEGYRTLMRRYGMQQEELARRVGRSPSAVANRLRLLKLSPAVRRRVLETGLTERHARALLKLSSESLQLEAISQILKKGLNVAKTEELIESMLAEKPEVPYRNVRLLLRSGKLFVNTVMDTVRQLNSAGLNCISRVEETPERIDIILSLERSSAQEIST